LTRHKRDTSLHPTPALNPIFSSWLTILLSRLVATLGAKSNTKKVNKKAILDVNVKKACETIMEPEAPMALRLQSNLL
jgi:hypothetical protein